MTNRDRAGRLHWLPWASSGVMCAVAVGALWQAHDLRSAPSAENKAIVDGVASAEVQRDVSQGLIRVLSYDYSDPALTESAAKDVLVEKAQSQYATLYQSLQERAPGQELVLSATVQVAAVKALTDREAILLVFVDQASHRATDKESTVSAAQLAITARKVGRTWKIADMTTR